MKTLTPSQKLISLAEKRVSELALEPGPNSATSALILKMVRALKQANREIRNLKLNGVEVEGNNGGSFVRLEPTEKQGMARLQVGEGCALTIDQDISVVALAAILTHAKDVGLQKTVDIYLNDIGSHGYKIAVERDLIPEPKPAIAKKAARKASSRAKKFFLFFPSA